MAAKLKMPKRQNLPKTPPKWTPKSFSFYYYGKFRTSTKVLRAGLGGKQIFMMKCSKNIQLIFIRKSIWRASNMNLSKGFDK